MSDRLHEIAIFVRTAERGSFSVAARELRMSQPSVSRTVAALEERLGVTLLLRNTRRITLTEAGRVLLERGRQLLADANDLEEATRGASELRGFLRVAATQGFGVRELAPLLPEFLAAHPKVKVELLLSDRFEDLIADQIDLAFRLGRLVGAGFTARRIQTLPRSLVASPRYLKRRGKPTALDDLPKHDCIGGPGAMGPEAWSFRRKGTVTSVTVDPRVVVASSLGLVAAAVQGVGITIVAHDMARAELASGALVPLLTDHALDTLELHAVYPAGRRPSLKARAFAEHVAMRLPSLA
jgi:DNA-binding transcriptional LysR family regulator